MFTFYLTCQGSSTFNVRILYFSSHIINCFWSYVFVCIHHVASVCLHVVCILSRCWLCFELFIILGPLLNCKMDLVATVSVGAIRKYWKFEFIGSVVYR
jgi:hypothetical protein